MSAAVSSSRYARTTCELELEHLLAGYFMSYNFVERTKELAPPTTPFARISAAVSSRYARATRTRFCVFQCVYVCVGTYLGTNIRNERERAHDVSRLRIQEKALTTVCTEDRHVLPFCNMNVLPFISSIPFISTSFTPFEVVS